VQVAQSPVDTDRPNLILLVLDTTRADGVLAPRSLPGFGDLMSQGTVFSQAVSTSPWTLPSHGSLFSGLLPHEHGLTGDAAVVSGHLRPLGTQIQALGERWLPARLGRAGYRTFAASANPWITPGMGWGFGFDRFESSWRDRTPRFQVGEGAGLAPRTRHLPRPLAQAAQFVYRDIRAMRGNEDSGAARSLAAFRDWLRNAGDATPYFAFFNFMEAHLPYLPPRLIGPRGPIGRLRAARLNSRLTNDFVVRYNVGREHLDEADLDLLRELYRGEIAYLDTRIADLVEEIRGHGRETVLIVVGDHGENLGENHLLGHQASLSNSLLWVPLIASGPEELVGRGRVIEPVSTCLTHGTLFHLAGVSEPYPSLFNRDPDEPALAWYESAYSEAAGARELADGELAGDPEASRLLKTRAWAAYLGAHKLVVRSDGHRQLFNVSSDPHETRDLSSLRPDIMRTFEDISLPLQPIVEACEYEDRAHLEEIERHLESLGYL
jgi:arylsulfatase A-like enzyme